MNKINKILILTIFFFLLGTALLSPVTVSAQIPTVKRGVRQETKEKIQNLRNKIVNIINGKVEAISGSTLSVSKDGKTYSVNTDGKTLLRRHFWGKSSLSEISVGDMVNVWGKWADDSQTTINARLIRDTSIMKRFGVFFGNIKSKDTASFVLQTLNRGDQTVVFDSNTKFINRKGQAINYSNVNIGDRVRVRGLWDKTLSKITEVTQVKDFSQPVKPTVTPKP